MNCMNYLFLDNGFEEIEAITTIDLLRRANIALTTVSLTGKPLVLGAHNVPVEADGLMDDIDFSDAEMLILPGGQTNLIEHANLCELLVAHNEADKLIAAICYAPSVLGQLGILEGKQATCYPGFEKYLGESLCRRPGGGEQERHHRQGTGPLIRLCVLPHRAPRLVGDSRPGIRRCAVLRY